MTSPHTFAKIAAVTLLLGLCIPAYADTLVGATAGVEVHASTSKATLRAEARAQVQANSIEKAKTRADQEIQRRIDALNKLAAKIAAMKHISDTNKASLTATIQTQISDMTSLQAKIDADTGTTTLKADVQSITKSYRIFALVIPQGAIEAAADREMDIASSMAIIGTKLQARITAAQTAGKDVTTLQSLLSDYNAKVTDSTTQAQAAVTAVASLTPDNGDQAKMQANLQALKTGRTDIKNGTQDLKAARQDAEKILKTLRTLNVKTSASASSTVSTHQ